jgi:hypothetical protein
VPTPLRPLCCVQYKPHHVVIQDCEKLRLPLAKHAVAQRLGAGPSIKHGGDVPCGTLAEPARRVSVKPFRVSLSHQNADEWAAMAQQAKVRGESFATMPPACHGGARNLDSGCAFTWYMDQW